MAAAHLRDGEELPPGQSLRSRSVEGGNSLQRRRGNFRVAQVGERKLCADRACFVWN